MMNRLFYITLGAALLLCACPTDTAETTSRPVEQPVVPGGQEDTTTQEDWGGAPSPAGPAPVLRSGDIAYDDDGQVSAVFAFSVNANIVGLSEGWEVANGNGTRTVTVVPADDVAPGPKMLSFTAENSANPAVKTVFAGKEVVVASGVFLRPGEDAACPAVYTAEYFDKYGAAGIISDDSTDETEWVYIKQDDSRLRVVLRAAAESGTPALFHITIAQTGEEDSVEIRGTELPESATINIGLPDDSDANKLLPEFSIPFGELGEAGKEYRHVRFRVNSNASLYIEADGNTPGTLSYAGVEVTAGGRLRSGTATGFPLGRGSYVISRLNSYLTAGDSLVIGPGREGPVFAWGTGDQNGGYVEIREVKTGSETWEGRVRFDANLIAQKTFSLSYSVWFIGGPSLTVSVPIADTDGRCGLFAETGKTPRFYGTSSFSGGQNIARPAAEIILNRGNSLSRCLIQDGDATDTLITAVSRDIKIRNGGSNGPPTAFTGDSGKAYFNWIVPQ